MSYNLLPRRNNNVRYAVVVCRNSDNINCIAPRCMTKEEWKEWQRVHAVCPNCGGELEDYAAQYYEYLESNPYDPDKDE